MITNNTFEVVIVSGVLPDSESTEEFFEALSSLGFIKFLTKSVEDCIGYKDGAWHIDLYLPKNVQFIFIKALQEGTLQKWRHRFA